MKKYNAEILVDGDNFDIIFECDKERNKECKKNNCGYCNHTTDTRYAKENNSEYNKEELLILIKELQDTLFQVMFMNKNIKDICDSKTPNQIRELFGFKKID